MNIESMRTRPYRSFAIDDDDDLPPAARERLLAIRRYDELRAAQQVCPMRHSPDARARVRHVAQPRGTELQPGPGLVDPHGQE